MTRKLSTMFFALSTMAFAVGIVVVPDAYGTTVSTKVATRAVTGVADVTAPVAVSVTNTNTATGRVAVRGLEVDATVNNVEVDRTVDVSNGVADFESVGSVLHVLNRVRRVDRPGIVRNAEVERVLSGGFLEPDTSELRKVNVVGVVNDVARVEAHVGERVVGLVKVTTNVRVNNGVDFVGDDVTVTRGVQSCFVPRSGLEDRFVSRNDDGVNLVSASYFANGTRVAGIERRGASSRKTKPASRWDAQAQWDMRTRMTRYGQDWSPVEETFRTNVRWSAKWELRWWGFKQNDGHTVWVYHRRSRMNGVRYTSVVDTNTGQWDGWQSVR